MTGNNPFKAARILETLENFSIVADQEIAKEPVAAIQDETVFHDAETFWKSILRSPETYWNKKITTNWFTLSLWVPRVPGLYWTSTAEKMRDEAYGHVAKYDGRSLELHPVGKSKMVAGGVGTIKLLPDDDGKCLYSMCSYQDSSEGIPVLLYPDIIEQFNVKEGYLIRLRNVEWRRMSESWAKRFAFTKDVPRGVFVISRPEQVEFKENKAPIRAYPFSIMEYEGPHSKLFDYVFATVTDFDKLEMRERVEMFFIQYATRNNRNGRYLINTNMVDNIFEAEFTSPADLQTPSQKAKMELLSERIKNLSFTQTNLDELIDLLPSHYETSLSIRTLSKTIGISNAFLQEDDAASMASQLINYCLKNGKIEELTARMCVDYPNIFKV